MNIKQLIEAGRYPIDKKGRPLVPMRAGFSATILATDVGDNWPIVGQFGGHVYRWNDDGTARSNEPGYGGELLPPAPRKVRVTAWAVIDQFDRRLRGTHVGPIFLTTSEEEARSYVRLLPHSHLVELSRDVEEPWS